MTEELRVGGTPIPGLLLIDLPVHGDERGWFKENWQREKMVAAGLPDFRPVQNNVSLNKSVGTTRGIHAEPWDKFISVVAGRVFGAWVDLRAGDTFGTVFTAELDHSMAIFVPRGVGNAFQTLEADTVYSYLVNAHWSVDGTYANLNVADESVAIDWPIPLEDAVLSDKDRGHPRLADVAPVQPRRTLILGANGQLGQALVEAMPDAIAWTHETFDISDSTAYKSVDWNEFDVIINAAAYTKVDEAETTQGRRDAWRINVSAVVELAKAATTHEITLVHISSDYVFDGEEKEHTTDEGFSPLGVYGQTKAAGDAVVMTVPRHYIVRTSWLIGAGHNFVATMERLAESAVNPEVVDDQIGQLTNAPDLSAAIARLLALGAEYGTYNITSGRGPQSWYQIACETFESRGHSSDRIIPVSTEAYGAGKNLAPRPKSSTLA